MRTRREKTKTKSAELVHLQETIAEAPLPRIPSQGHDSATHWKTLTGQMMCDTTGRIAPLVVDDRCIMCLQPWERDKVAQRIREDARTTAATLAAPGY